MRVEQFKQIVKSCNWVWMAEFMMDYKKELTGVRIGKDIEIIRISPYAIVLKELFKSYAKLL